jgi:aminoglycoside N3'-acetyltransferase
MKEISSEQIAACLRSLGLKAGDGVMVHSALQFLGKPRNGLADYCEAFCQVLSIDLEDESRSSGTLAVPVFNFGFAKGEPYDPKTTPSVGMGALAEYIRTLPIARRTTHPMQSFAVIGAHAEDISRCDTLGAFDAGSAFERMLDLDFKLLLLGADIQAVSAVHYCEQRANVPYRYWKDFSGKILINGRWETRTYRMFVRDLQLDPHLKFYPIQKLLEERGQWKAERLNYGFVSVCRLQDFIKAGDDILRENVNALMGN